jgi:folate-binding protein YgfZ
LKVDSLTSDALSSLRIAEGKPLYGSEIGIVPGKKAPRFSALELGMMRMLHFRKGCYVGNEAVSRTVSTNAIRKKLCCLKFSSHEDVSKLRTALVAAAPEPIELLDENDEVAITLTSVSPLVTWNNSFAKNSDHMPQALGLVRAKLAIPGSILMLRPNNDDFISRVEILPSKYAAFSIDHSPAPPVPKALSKPSSTAQVEVSQEEQRRAEKLKIMQENLLKFQAKKK